MCIWRHVKLLTYRNIPLHRHFPSKCLMYTMGYKIADKQPAPKIKNKNIKKKKKIQLLFWKCLFVDTILEAHHVVPQNPEQFWEEVPKSEKNRADILNIFHNEWIRDRARRQEETWRKVHRSMGLAFPFVRAYWALLALALKNVAKCFMCLPRYSS